MEKGNYDVLEFAETLRMAQHDLGMGQNILQKNEFIFKHGLNLKVLRQNNLRLQSAEAALKKYKEELMKTEIIAPFDGVVVDVGVKENDQLSAYDYSTVTAVYLVDTKTVELQGSVDEVDIFKVKRGQKARIVVDALPNRDLSGTVTFISPFGTQKTGVVNYAVTIKLEPTDVDLRGGLTATAYIAVDKRENVLIIPNGGIKRVRGNTVAEVVLNEKTMKTEERQIVIGIQNELFAEVISGLQEREKVMVEKGRSPTRRLF